VRNYFNLLVREHLQKFLDGVCMLICGTGCCCPIQSSPVLGLCSGSSVSGPGLFGITCRILGTLLKQCCHSFNFILGGWVKQVRALGDHSHVLAINIAAASACHEKQRLTFFV
jgi:hypothetical protein